jgi:hypothetical protein
MAMSAKFTPVVERLLYNTEITAKCWLWKASKFKDGYGQIKLNGKNCKVHRIAYELFVGPIGNSCVLHVCDTPACIRPQHLFLGSNLENISDRTKKGRTAKGEKHHWTKLTTETVLKIRRLHLDGHSYRVIAKMLGVPRGNVAPIVQRKTWKDLYEVQGRNPQTLPGR